jgi:hypothetical protein
MDITDEKAVPPPVGPSVNLGNHFPPTPPGMQLSVALSQHSSQTYELPRSFDALYGAGATPSKHNNSDSLTNIDVPETALLPMESLCAEVFGEIDSERAEAIVFMANYYHYYESNDPDSQARAHRYCSLLLDYHGPEGEEARRMLRDMTHTENGLRHQGTPCG